jgi:hypothetical protein
MPNACVYLHETIDIVGTGSETYKSQTGQLGTGRQDGGAPLVGTWQQSGSTGAWPKVVNLWEMRDWDHWAEILASQYTRGSGQTPKLKKWWTEAARYRSGGFDRILVSAAYGPTRQELIHAGVKGVATLQEVATLRPGTAPEYLAAVARRQRPAMEHRGMVLTGAFRTAMRDTEVILHWNVPDYGDFTGYLRDVEQSRAEQAWRKLARRWRVDFRETLLVASPWCVQHDAWREPSKVRRLPRAERA